MPTSAPVVETGPGTDAASLPDTSVSAPPPAAPAHVPPVRPPDAAPRVARPGATTDAVAAKPAPRPSAAPTTPQWVVAPANPLRGEWADRLKVSPVTAQVLLNRLPADLTLARRFLRPAWDDLHDPELLPDILPIAERLHRAIRDRERIVVYGDYDVDGIAGTSLLWHCLKLAGADVDYYIPHRIEEGYGLHAAALRELHAAGARVVVTVDCGISGHAAATAARELGLTLLITDHHEPGDTLPDADAVMNPKRADSRYPDRELCGAGLAFKLAWQLGRAIAGQKKVNADFREFLVAAAGLAGLATITDVVPLALENRVLASRGLGGLHRSTNPGIRALLEAAGVDAKVDEHAAGFLLGPRINAAGRMGHARLAVEMLTTAGPARAAEIARYLEAQNEDRRREDQKTLAHARAKIAKGRIDPDADRCIVLWDEDWHPGVVGIVAGRLVEEFHRPVVLMWVKDGLAGGSGRSIEGFDLHAALDVCREICVSCGGHAMAGGLKLKTERLDDFRAAFVGHCQGRVSDAMLVPKLKIDAEVPLAAVNQGLLAELELLKPFGNGNPRPLLAACEVVITGEPRVMKDVHLSFTASQGGRGFRCVFWRRADLAPRLRSGTRVDVAFRPKWNDYGGGSVELEVQDVRHK